MKSVIQRRGAINTFFIVLYAVLYILIPLVFILIYQNRAAGESVAKDLLLGFGNLVFFITAFIFLVVYLPKRNSQVLSLFVPFILSFFITYGTSPANNFFNVMLVQSVAVYIGLLASFVILCLEFLFRVPGQKRSHGFVFLLFMIIPGYAMFSMFLSGVGAQNIIDPREFSIYFFSVQVLQLVLFHYFIIRKEIFQD